MNYYTCGSKTRVHICQHKTPQVPQPKFLFSVLCVLLCCSIIVVTDLYNVLTVEHLYMRTATLLPTAP